MPLLVVAFDLPESSHAHQLIAALASTLSFLFDSPQLAARALFYLSSCKRIRFSQSGAFAAQRSHFFSSAFIFLQSSCTRLLVAALAFRSLPPTPHTVRISTPGTMSLNDTNVTRNGKHEQAFRPRCGEKSEQVSRRTAFRPEAYPYYRRALLST